MLNPKAFPDLVELNVKGDHRGQLVALEEHLDVPFDIKRVYYIYNTKQDVERGFHAHLKLKQLVIAVSGSCDFCLDNGASKKVYRLDSPDKSLLLEGLYWREMKNFSKDCVLLVLANMFFDESDYIRNYDEFIALFDSKDLNLDKY